MPDVSVIIRLPAIFYTLREKISQNTAITGKSCNITFETSDNNQFQIVLPERNLFIETVDFICSESNAIQLVYCHGCSIDTVRFNLVTNNLCAYLNLNSDSGRCTDVWMTNGLVQSVTCPSSFPFTLLGKEDHLSWVLSLIALSYPLEDVFLLANTLVRSDVSRETWESTVTSLDVSVCESPLGEHLRSYNYQKLGIIGSSKSIGLYPVVASSKKIEALLRMGIKTVQLRLKSSCECSNDAIESEIVKSIALGRRYQARVFINDYWELAIEHGAFGVHLGQEDLVKADLERIAKQGLALGISTHSYYEVIRALGINPSYIALGHVFPTPTKKMKSLPQGLENLRLYNRLIKNKSMNIPTVAIGGINESNVFSVLQSGVDGYAVVRAVTESNDLSRTIKQLKTKSRN